MALPPMTIETRDVPPRTAWALEQAGVHPLLARLFAARGVRGADELDDAPGAPAAAGRPARRGRRRACCSPTRSAPAAASASSPTTTATAPPPAPSRCAACACSAPTPATLRYVVPDRARARLRADAGDRRPRAARKRPDVLMTVDNGIASLEGVAHARRAGSRSWSPTTTCRRSSTAACVLPEADVIVNPNQPGCGFASKHLAGVGVDVLRAARAARRAARARRVHAGRRSRGSTRCSTWSRSARWPTSSGSTATTAASSRRA